MKRSDIATTPEYGTSRPERVVLHWVGDISLNGYLCSPQYQTLLRARMSELRCDSGPCDLAVGNFEAPIWGNGRENHCKKTRVCTTTQAAECILPLGLDLVFLGNNHVYDCCEEGFRNTRQFLSEHGIKLLGAGTSQEEAGEPVVLERQGLKLGFLNYVHRNTNPSIPPNAEVALNYFDDERALEDVRVLSQRVDAVLLYLHWGKHELVRLPSLAQRRFGRRAVEAGARIVVFDHAHCLQPHEPWKKGHIIYGLGNFIFSDLPDSKWTPLACLTAMAHIEISRGRVQTVSFSYLRREDHVPSWDRRLSRVRSHRRLEACLHLPDILYRLIYAWETFYQLEIMSCYQFIRKHGGIIPAVSQLRPRHLRKVARWLVRPSGCTSQ